MRKYALLCAAVITTGMAFAGAPASADTATSPVVVPGGPGHFDWMNIDGKSHRLFASHPGTKSITVMDLLTNKAQSIDCGSEVNGVAIDKADNKIFAAGGGQNVVVLDATTYAKLDTIPLTGPADAVTYNPKNGIVYIDHDDGTEIWTIDAKTNKITGSITIAGAPEFMQFDRNSQLLYQNIKPTDQLQVIDMAKGAVVNTWSTKPVTSPHGLAIAGKLGLALVAGKNGKLVAIDVKTGKVVSSCDIKPGVDQMAYSGKTKLAYCACKGFLSVVSVGSDGLKNVTDVEIPAGAHTLAVDGATNNVWVSYSDKENSYLSCVYTTKTASAD